MSLALKNKKTSFTTDVTYLWQPSAAIDVLKTRAKLLADIRAFFSEKNILEVDTPLLSHGTITDPHIQAIPAFFKTDLSSDAQITYLQTSPEYAMKRLLCAGMGSIYQICKAFRQGEKGSLHNPEFTMLEWYRLGFDHRDLMQEVDELLQRILKTKPSLRFTYAELFELYLAINPHTASIDELKRCAESQAIQLDSDLADRDAWLSLLMSHCIEPQLGKEIPAFIYDFPASQAALAKIRYDENPPVASRFELYFKGIELANGFHELSKPDEQRQRFENDLRLRKKLGLPEVPIDERFLEALQHGLPECSGVALGIDRLIMLALNSPTLQHVLSFDFTRA